MRLVLDEAAGDVLVLRVFRAVSGLSFNWETANFVWFNPKELIIISFSLTVSLAPAGIMGYTCSTLFTGEFTGIRKYSIATMTTCCSTCSQSHKWETAVPLLPWSSLHCRCKLTLGQGEWDVGSFSSVRWTSWWWSLKLTFIWLVNHYILRFSSHKIEIEDRSNSSLTTV